LREELPALITKIFMIFSLSIVIVALLY